MIGSNPPHLHASRGLPIGTGPPRSSDSRRSGMSAGSPRRSSSEDSKAALPKLPSVSELLTGSSLTLGNPPYGQPPVPQGYTDPRARASSSGTPPSGYGHVPGNFPPQPYPHLSGRAYEPRPPPLPAGAPYNAAARTSMPPMGQMPPTMAPGPSSTPPTYHPYPAGPIGYDPNLQYGDKGQVVARPVRKLVSERVIAGEGVCYVYDDGSYVQKEIDGELVNADWGITKAGKPRKRLAIACKTCRDKKIKCEPAEPKCVQCDKSGRECHFETARVPRR